MKNDSHISSKTGHGTGHIKQSLVVNGLIAVSKGVAAFVTGSGAMLAETIHSFADCANQALLLLGVKQSRKPPTASHPLGYGRSVYFWSFMVAMLLFSVGGMFSIYEGIHKFYSPEPVDQIWWGVGVLIFAIVLEGYATLSNIKEIRKRRKNKSFFHYIRHTKDSDMVVVFGENSAAVLGLIFALAALLTAHYLEDPRFDALGSLAIGLVLIAVAIFLATEVKSLLMGESADPEIMEFIGELVEHDPNIEKVLKCITLQQGPGEVLVCMKIKCVSDVDFSKIGKLINEFEEKLVQAKPEIKWLYVEPDLWE